MTLYKGLLLALLVGILFGLDYVGGCLLDLAVVIDDVREDYS